MEKVLGMGNALVDIMISLDSDDFLKKYNLPKGSMQLVDIDLSGKVLDGAKNLRKQQTSGGSAANTIHGLARLGVGTAFIGKVGEDEMGSFFSADMQNSKIKPELLKSKTESGRAMALISPDSERTFATYLGAAVELNAEDLTPEMFEGYKYFHIEGYLVQNHSLLQKAVEQAKQKNIIISLDLASYNVVEANLDFLKTITNNYIDIVFANEEEAKTFTGKEPKEALDEIALMCDIAVVKVGKNGSYIKQGENIYEVGPIDAIKIDTTGAGDLYAAGFLYGLLNNLSLDKCGKTGTVLAGNIIEVIGAKMEKERWNKIKKLVKTIIYS